TGGVSRNVRQTRILPFILPILPLTQAASASGENRSTLAPMRRYGRPWRLIASRGTGSLIPRKAHAEALSNTGGNPRRASAGASGCRADVDVAPFSCRIIGPLLLRHRERVLNVASTRSRPPSHHDGRSMTRQRRRRTAPEPAARRPANLRGVRTTR